MRKTVGGITGVLDGLTDDSTPVTPKPQPQRLHDKPTPPVGDRPPNKKPNVAARRGRPPGRKTGDTPPKTKTTLWVNADIIAEYRDWSWDEKCNVGELVERALTDYRRRHRRTPSRDAA